MKVLTTLFTILVILSCKAQEKETVYLIFKENSKAQCDFSAYRDGREKKTISYKHLKRELSDEIIFEMCYAQFKVIDDLSYKKVNNIKVLNVVDMNYMYSEIEKNWPKTAKEVHFKKIYILEEKEEGEYMKHEVKWIDSFR